MWYVQRVSKNVIPLACYNSDICEQFFGPPFVKRFALCYMTVVLSVCNVRALWPNGWTD